VLEIVEGGGEFNLESLDFAAYASSGAGSQTLEVEGFLGGSLVGVDQYTLSNTKNYDPSYPNWTTEDASVLAGKNIDELEIVLNAGLRPDFFTEAIDNVVLTAPGGPAPVPEPSSLLLLGSGLLGLAGTLKRKFIS
jgi:hypothetical protein